MRTLPLAAATWILAACSASALSGSDPTCEASTAVGEPELGYPTYEERLFLHLANRLRLDPTKASEIGCPRNFDVPTKPPLEYSRTLSFAARFHARTVAGAPCIQHDSCCHILDTGLSAYCCDNPEGVGCSAVAPRFTCQVCGGSACAGTTWDTRIRDVFGYGRGGSTIGENIHIGLSTAEGALCKFFDEGPDTGDGQEHGHFLNLMSMPIGSNDPSRVQWNELGTGFFGDGTCSVGTGTLSRLAWVQDFGMRDGVPASAIPSAAHRPASGAGVTLSAIWREAAAPSRIHAVVDGRCLPLELKVGSASAGAFETTTSLAPGCHAWYVLAVDAAGRAIFHPDEGSLLAGDGVGACAADYTRDRVRADCLPAPADAGAEPDAGVATDAGGAADPDGGGAPPPVESPPGCGCAASGAPAALAAPIALWVVAYRRRR